MGVSWSRVCLGEEGRVEVTAIGQDHPERGLGSKPALTLCPWSHWRHRQTQLPPVAPCGVVQPQTPHAPSAPNPRAGKPSTTGGSGVVLMDRLLLSTTGGHYPITICAQAAAGSGREGEGKGTIPLASIWGGGGG